MSKNELWTKIVSRTNNLLFYSYIVFYSNVVITDFKPLWATQTQRG